MSFSPYWCVFRLMPLLGSFMYSINFVPRFSVGVFLAFSMASNGD